MKFTLSAALLSFASIAASSSIRLPRSCPEASRFGDLTVSPTTVSPGDSITVNVDLECAINSFGHVPKYLDYTLEVPASSNNGYEVPVVLARREFTAGATSDTFTVQVPFASYFAGGAYGVHLRNTYSTQGTDGSEVLIEGGVYTGTVLVG
ncbi:hypothetical protein H0H87_008821 [Tephrocybe sp. NHM501043]|nr:hypothetical protein H0H87_008821 [Tephrocybe sp. NHM501043]